MTHERSVAGNTVPGAWCKPLPWEERNLQRPSYGVEQAALAAMSAAEVQQELAALEANGPVFVQARIEGHDTRLNALLEQHGFVFVESTIDPYSVLARNDVLTAFLAAPERCVPRKCTVQELTLTVLPRGDEAARARVLAIAEESFVADRFHVDHRCPRELAGRRFRYWVEDLLEDSAAHCVVLTHAGTLAGFFIYKEAHLILAGFARAYAGSGLGDFFWLSVMKRVHAEGHDMVHTRISMNNVPVLNLYVRLHYKFRNPAAVFHYWSDAQL